jgi:hypothetical protein
VVVVGAVRAVGIVGIVKTVKTVGAVKTVIVVVDVETGSCCLQIVIGCFTVDLFHLYILTNYLFNESTITVK